MTRLAARVLLLLAVSIVAPAVAVAPASAHQQPVHAFSGTYKGSISYKDNDQPNTSDGANGLITTETLSWAVKVVEDYRGAKMVSGYIKQSAQGTITQTCVSGGGPCSAPASCQLRQITTSPKLPGGETAGPEPFRGHPQAAGASFSIPALMAFDVQGGGAGCDTDTNSQAGYYIAGVCFGIPDNVGQSKEFQEGTLTPTLVADSGSGGKGFNTNQSLTENCYGAPETVTRTLQASISVNGGHAPPHHNPPQNNDAERQLEKQIAGFDLVETLKLVSVPCGAAVLGATSLVWGTVVPGVGTAALIPATLLGSHYGVMCGYMALRIYDDAQTLKDPPRADYNVVATVKPERAPATDAASACANYKPSERTFCDQVEKKLTAYVAAVRHATDVDGAIVTTIDRQTAALKARNRSAQAKQDAAGKKLESQFHAALRAEAGDGKALAALISAHHIYARLSTQQDATAIAAAKRRLSRHPQTTQAALAKLLGAGKLAGVFSPAPVNLLSLLR